MKSPKAKIGSDPISRLEVEHIENMIRGMTVIPDFGFPIDGDLIFQDEQEDLDSSQELIKGWQTLKDLIVNDFKYERFENYVQAVHL